MPLPGFSTLRAPEDPNVVMRRLGIAAPAQDVSSPPQMGLRQYLSQTPEAFRPGPAYQPQLEAPLPQGQMDTPKALGLMGVQGLGQTGQLQAPTQLQQQAVEKPKAVQDWENLQAQGASQHHGFLGRFKDAGIGLLLGGIPGAITGAVAPQVIHNIRHQIGLSQLGQQADQSLQNQQALRQGLSQYGAETGQPYGTTQPTLPYREFQQRQQGIEAQREFNRVLGMGRLDQGQQKINQGDQRLSLSARRALTNQFNAEIGYLTKGGIVPGAEDIQALASKYGMVLPNGFDPTKHQLGVDAAGNDILVQISGAGAGQARPVTSGNKPVASFKQPQEAGKNARAANAQAGADRRANMRQGQSRASVAASITDAWMKAGKTPSGLPIVNGRVIDPNVKLTPAESSRAETSVYFDPSVDVKNPASVQAAVEAKKNEIRASKAQPLEKHPEYRRAITSGMAGRSQSAPPPPLTKANIKPGGIYMHEGKRIKISKVNPDQTFTADVLP